MKISREALLLGLPIKVNKYISVYPLTLNEIYADEEEYRKCLSLLVSKEENKDNYGNICDLYEQYGMLKNELNYSLKSKLSKEVLDNLRLTHDYGILLIKAFKIFLHKDVKLGYINDNKCLYIKENVDKNSFEDLFMDSDVECKDKKDVIISKEDFENIRKVLCVQNMIEKLEDKTNEDIESHLKKMTPHGRRVYLNILKGRKKLEEDRKKNIDPDKCLGIDDIILCLSNIEGNDINLINIGQLKLYPFHYNFNVGMDKDSYKTEFQLKFISQNIKEQNKIKAEHWIKKRK